jgi:hypothetical protein
MDVKINSRLATALLLSSLLAACASTASLRAVRAPEYSGDIRRLFVVANMGGGLANRDGDNARAFTEVFTSALDRCGVVAKAFLQPPGVDLSLNNDSLEKMKAALGELKPDALLSINWHTRRFDTRGWNETTYLLQLQDAKTRATVWKAEATVTTHWYPAQVVAGAIIDRLRQDAMINPACAVKRT